MPSNSAPGSGRGRTPVATTIDSAVIFSSPTCSVLGSDDLGGAKLGRHFIFTKKAFNTLVELAGNASITRDHLREVPGGLPAVTERLAVVLDEVDEVGVGRGRPVGMQPQFRQIPPACRLPRRGPAF